MRMQMKRRKEDPVLVIAKRIQDPVLVSVVSLHWGRKICELAH